MMLSGGRRKILAIVLCLHLLALCLMLVLPDFWFPPHDGATRSSFSATSGQIPHIFHQKWKTRFVPKEYKPYLMSLTKHHPTWKHVWWEDEVDEEFLSRRYPEYLDLYHRYTYDIMRADALRYFYMYEFGGVYIDLDYENFKPMEELLEAFGPCLISEQPAGMAYFTHRIPDVYYNTGFMACRPKHPFFRFAISGLRESFRTYSHDTLKCTGPFFITRMVQEYKRKYRNRAAADDILVLPAKYIQPTYGPHFLRHVIEGCKNVSDALARGVELGKNTRDLFQKQKQLCTAMQHSGFANVPLPESYTDHKWTASWKTPNQHRYTGENSNANFDIEEVLPKRISPFALRTR